MIKLLFILLMSMHSAWGARLKDLATLRGVRDNQLVGYGLVVGLSGTGDKGLDLTNQSLKLLLRGLEVDLSPEMVETKNVAVVVATATLKPFTKAGAHLDVQLSSIGSADSLEGGTLLLTPLKGADGKVYGLAQGKAQNENAKGPTGVAALVKGGAVLERAVDFDISKLKEIRYLLKAPDFTTAARAAHRINESLGAKYAAAVDAGTIEIVFPMGFEGNLVELVSKIENVELEVDAKAKVVANRTTGTVILGHNVSVSPVAIAHSNLRIEVQKPQPDTVSASGERRPAKAKKESHAIMFAGGASVADVASSLNAMGATPDDLIAILQSLEASGALAAELVVQ